MGVKYMPEAVVLPSPSPRTESPDDPFQEKAGEGSTLGTSTPTWPSDEHDLPGENKLKLIRHSVWLTKQTEIFSEDKDAGGGEAESKDMTFFGCVRRYPKALAWSLVLLLAVMMEAYGKLLINGLSALPAFSERFGEFVGPAGESEKKIPLIWQMSIQNASTLAEMVGLLICGYISHMTGYRVLMLACIGWTCIGVFPAFFARNLPTLLVSQIICGISWGAVQILAVTYAAEIVPSLLRAFVLSNVNTCWIVGQVIVSGVFRGVSNGTSEWTYRIPMAMQWAWAIVPLIAVFFAPESPWWLVRRNRPQDARRAIRSLSSQDDLDIDKAVALMEHTDKVEKELQYGGATYKQLFRGTNRRRTEIACIVWMCQGLSGSTMIRYAPFLFQRNGINTPASFGIWTIIYAVAFLSSVSSFILLQYIGRRKLYLIGLANAVILLATTGTVSAVLEGKKGGSQALVGLIVAVTLNYNLFIGPVCYVLVTEIPAIRLRVKTMAVARVTYLAISTLNNTLGSRMLSTTGWDWKGKTAFYYATTALLCLTWCYFRLPETWKLSYLELDILFEMKAPAAKFRKFQAVIDDSPYVSQSSEERLVNPWHGWVSYS